MQRDLKHLIFLKVLRILCLAYGFKFTQAKCNEIQNARIKLFENLYIVIHFYSYHDFMFNLIIQNLAQR